MENNTFDETDLNFLYAAVRHQIKTVNWNVSDEEDWVQLKALKELDDRIARAIDGEVQ